jgi:hypothetical protein
MGIQELLRVTEACLLLEVLVQLAVVFAFLFAGLFLVRVGLMDDKVMREDIVIYSGDVDLEQTGLI